MNGFRNLAFYLGMATLMTHEIDAVPNHEWRSMVLLRALSDETAMVVFIAMHVPLFAVLIALVASTNPRIREISRFTIGGFLVLHGLLHGLSSGHPAYEFSSTLSHLLIYGGSFLGALFLVGEAYARVGHAPR